MKVDKRSAHPVLVIRSHLSPDWPLVRGELNNKLFGLILVILILAILMLIRILVGWDRLVLVFSQSDQFGGRKLQS